MEYQSMTVGKTARDCVVQVVVLAAPKEDRRRFMLHAHDSGMTKGDYVFYTIDMLPDEEVIDPESVWKGNDGRDAESRDAFESVFHVSNPPERLTRNKIKYGCCSICAFISFYIVLFQPFVRPT